MLSSKPVKGMRDIVPSDMRLRNYVLSTIVNTYEKFGFSTIETPCIEGIELLTGGHGGENEKLIFKILKRGKKLNLESFNEGELCDLALRYDLTVPLSRFYANNRHNLPNPFKSIQIGSVWRAENPQKGRYRQFTQCDIDIIGIDNINAEIELIVATSQALLNLEFSNFTVRISDRGLLKELVNYCQFPEIQHDKVFITLDKLDKIGIIGVQKELEENNFDKQSINEFISIIQKKDILYSNIHEIYTLLPSVSTEVIDNLEKVINTVKSLSNNGYKIVFDISLVRGMGYYTGQIFEIEIPDYKSSIAGGGRYNRMIGKMLKNNENIPACGFSIGFERVVSIIESRNLKSYDNKKYLLLFYESDDDIVDIMKNVQQFQDQSFNVLLLEKPKNLSKVLNSYQTEGYSHFAIYNKRDMVVRVIQ
jgi:histidyl-tRNA synthetase